MVDISEREGGEVFTIRHLSREDQHIGFFCGLIYPPIPQIPHNTMWTNNIRCPSDQRIPSICREHNRRSERRFKEGVEVGEGLEVEHVDLVDDRRGYLT
jgi:hypothetical protein